MDAQNAHTGMIAYIHILEAEIRNVNKKLRKAYGQLGASTLDDMHETYGVSIDRVIYRPNRHTIYPCTECDTTKYLRLQTCSICGINGVDCTRCLHGNEWYVCDAICCGKPYYICSDHNLHDLPAGIVYTCGFHGNIIICCCRPYTLTQQCTDCNEIKLICVNCVYNPTSQCDDCAIAHQNADASEVSSDSE
jgi:hypothetical protein